MVEIDGSRTQSFSKILAIGDVHLGTRPSSVPADIGLDIERLTPAQALDEATEFAIQQEVDAVLFAGDVVESTNDRFEALRPLQNAVNKLVSAGIEVLGVAGNHDIDALPRLAKMIPEFKLVGAGGTWEKVVLTKDGSPFVQILGWSFGSKKVTESPLLDLIKDKPELDPTSPTIGLLHCDLGVIDSPYAPVRNEELDAVPTDAWLLGHIHRPSLNVKDGQVVGKPNGYLGSLMGLHPLETGTHGPWLIELEGNRIAQMRHVPLVPLRWEHIDLNVDGLSDVEDIKDRIMAELPRVAEMLLDESEKLNAVGLRVSLVGTIHCVDELADWVSSGQWDQLFRSHQGVTVFVNKVRDHTDLPLDIDAIAKGSSPPALLAQKMVMLRNKGEGASELLEEARAKLSDVTGQYWWAPLDEHRNATDPLADNVLSERLMLAARTALYQLLEQQDSEGVGS